MVLKTHDEEINASAQVNGGVAQDATVSDGAYQQLMQNTTGLVITVLAAAAGSQQAVYEAAERVYNKSGSLVTGDSYSAALGKEVGAIIERNVRIEASKGMEAFALGA